MKSHGHCEVLARLGKHKESIVVLEDPSVHVKCHLVGSPAVAASVECLLKGRSLLFESGMFPPELGLLLLKLELVVI